MLDGEQLSCPRLPGQPLHVADATGKHRRPGERILTRYGAVRRVPQDLANKLRSVSGPGVSLVITTFQLDRDIESAAPDVRDRVSADPEVRNFLTVNHFYPIHLAGQVSQRLS